MDASSPPKSAHRSGLWELANNTSHAGALLVILRHLSKRAPSLAPTTASVAALLKRYTDRQNRLFDERFGTDTYARVELSKLGVPELTGYDFDGWGTCPVNESFFHEMMGATPASFQRFTFIDVGAGKGKAMMLATEYPFRRVVGVELAAGLAAVARTNVARYCAHRRREVPVEVLCQDFLAWPLPVEPGLLFFNDPFPFHIAERAIAHVEASLRANPRPVFVVYRKAEKAVLDRLDRSPLLAPVRFSPFWRVYRGQA